MNKIDVLIIEDEKIFADNLEQILLQLNNGIKVKAKVGSVSGAVNWLQANEADLILLDIHLSDGLSFEIFEQIEISTPIIFITSYDQYAIQAFKVNSIDYLLKPVNIDELQRSLDKFQKLGFKSNTTDNYRQLIDMMMNKQPEFKKRFMIQTGDKIKTISTNDIAYFYVLKRNVFLRVFSGKSYPLDFTLDKLELMLNPDVFFRINRQFIINIESIGNMYSLSKSRMKIELTPPSDDEAIVSLSRASDFRKWLSK